MKKVFFLFFFAGIFIFGSKGQNKLSFYAEISPVYSYRTYVAKESQIPPWLLATEEDLLYIIKDDYDERESPRFGYSLSLGVNYPVNKWLQFKTGIGIKDIGEKVEYHKILELLEYGNYTVPVYEEEMTTTNNKYLYVSLPFDFELILLKKERFSLGLTTGSDFDFLLKSSLVNDLKENQTELKYRTAEFSKFAVNIHGGFVAIIKLSKKFGVSFSPQFTRYVTPNLTFETDSETELYIKINQYNYYGQLKVGIVLN